MIITVTVRARYYDGTLQLLEPLDVADLEEGAKVGITVCGILPPDGDPDAGDTWDDLARSIRERRNSLWISTATYCAGAFRTVKPLDLDEGEVVRLTIGKVPPGEGEAHELIQINYEYRVPGSRTPTAS